MPSDGIRVADSGYVYCLTLVDRYNAERVLTEAATKFPDYLGDDLPEVVEFEHAGFTVKAVREDAGDENA